jgi:hypothetical protein
LSILPCLEEGQVLLNQYCVPAARFADAIAWCARSIEMPRVLRT